MRKKEIALIVVSGLEKIYPETACMLEYNKEKPYELMIAGRLSAQCTDARVNIVTKTLFARFQSLEEFADADISEIEEIVKPCGLYKTKAKSIVQMCQMLIEKFDGKIPKTIEELTSLSGIGRKTANLIMGDINGEPAIVTDTHFIRITRRLGLTANSDPKKVEDDLRVLIPPEKSSDFCHRIVFFGREYCSARTPKCNECPLKSYINENISEKNKFECRIEKK